MLLTIGMIVKNEEKWLDKCLSAINPILDNVESELIITDTGSTDKTVEIAKRYTKNILHFDWIDDFAAARNFGLKKAKGKWFMFLDADEIFSSCDNIIYFFKSGEYKKYNSATFVIRNVLDDNEYTDFKASRLIKITENTSFSGIVHEYLIGFLPPIKNLDDIAMHYGYVSNDIELKRRKAERNILMMQKKIDSGDDNPLNYLYMYDSLVMSGKDDEAERFIDLGIEHCEKINSVYGAVYYLKKTIHYLKQERYDDALDVCEKYFLPDNPIRKNRLTTDVEMYAIKASVMYEHFNFDDAIKTFVLFFDTYADIKSGDLDTDDTSALNFQFATDKNVVGYLTSLAESCLYSNNFEPALNCLSKININDLPVDENQISKLVDKEVDLLRNTSYKASGILFENMNDFGRKQLKMMLVNDLYTLPCKKDIISALKKIGDFDPMMKEKSDIYEGYFIDDTVSISKLESYVTRYSILENCDILKITMDSSDDASFIFKDDNTDIAKLAYICCKSIGGFYDSIENYDINLFKDLSIMYRFISFYRYCMNALLIDQYQDKANLDMLLKTYVRNVKRYSESENTINKTIVAAGLIECAIKYKENNDIRNFLDSSKKAIRTDTEIANIVSGYVDYVIHETGLKDKSVENEKQRLSQMIKKNIKIYIANGNVHEAVKTINEYAILNPNDPEIEALRKELGI